MSMCEFDQNLETMPCSERNSIRECAYLRKELDQNNCVNEYKRRELGAERGASHREVLFEETNDICIKNRCRKVGDK